MTIILENKSVSQNLTSTPISVKEVRDRLTVKAIETACAIVADNTERMEGYKQNIQLLNSGIFYGNEYFKALQATNQKARLDFFLKKGSFYHGYASPKHFNMLKNDRSSSGIFVNRFVLKEGVTPSAALEAIRQGPSFIGCGETCQIAYYEAIKDVLGKEKFNVLFAANSSTPLLIQFDNPDNPINCLIDRTISPKRMTKGQMVYIKNIPYYPIKHLNGEASGFFAICCDDTFKKETFTTLGLRSEGMTHAEVDQILLKEFNDKPIGMAIVTEEVAKRIFSSYSPMELSLSKQYETVQFSKKEFAEQGGGQMIASFELNAERIAQLANSSLEEVQVLFNKMAKN